MGKLKGMRLEADRKIIEGDEVEVKDSKEDMEIESYANKSRLELDLKV